MEVEYNFNIDDDAKAKFTELLAKAREEGMKEGIAKGKTNEKPICPAAVKLPTKAKVKEKIGKNVEVFLEEYLDGNSRTQTRAWARCTRACWMPQGENKYRQCCYKHEDSNTTNIYAEYIDSAKVRLATLEDKYLNKKVKKGTSKSTNDAIDLYLVKNPALTAKLTSLLESLQEFQASLGEGVKPSEMNKNNEAGDEAGDEAADDEAADDEAGDEASSDGEIECIEIQTVDGRTLALDPESLTVYEPEGDDSEVLGKLYQAVLKRGAPIIRKDQPDDFPVDGNRFIVGYDWEDPKGNTYLRCAITDWCFNKNDEDVVKKIGKAVKKGGEYVFKKN